MSHRAEWIGMLTSVCVVLGGLLALTVKTQQSVATNFPSVHGSYELQQEWRLQQEKIRQLQGALAEVRQSPDGTSPATRRLSMLSAVVPLKGPGLTILLSDMPSAEANKSTIVQDNPELGLTHDVDLLRVVNELFASGAEAISLNDQRIGPRTAIRCAGPTVLVNQVPCAKPFRFQVIGDPDTLYGAMTLTNGILDELQHFDLAVHIEKSKLVTVPAYDAAVPFKFARPIAPGRESRDAS
jgi:uncharacterized protein YlxW (UPF0749 family)